MMRLCEGIQHIGLPTADIEKAKAFYQELGFEIPYETVLPGPQKVAFLQSGTMMIEMYEDETVGAAGAINHVAMDCKDIEAAFAMAKDRGYTILSNDIEDLPFWENGVRFFIIEGPDKERIEFNQKL